MIVLFSCRKNEEFLSEPVIEVPPPIVIGDTDFLGTAHDELGAVVPGTTVTLFHNGLAMGADIADAQGRFTFRDLPFSDTAYVLQLVHDDFSTTNRSYRTSGHLTDELAVEMPSLRYFQTAAEIDLTNSELVSVRGVIEDADGNPAEGIVTIKDGNLNIHEHVAADHTGEFEAFVAKGIEYDFTLTSFCGHTFVEEEIGPFDESKDLGTFVSATPGRLLTIEGIVKNCNGQAVSNDYLILKHNEDFPTIITTDENGRFAMALHDCQIEAGEITVVAYDHETEMVSAPTTIAQLSGNFEFGEIQTCLPDSSHISGSINSTENFAVHTQYAHVSDGNTYVRPFEAKNGISMDIPFAEFGEGEIDSFDWYVDGELYATKGMGAIIVNIFIINEGNYLNINATVEGTLFFPETQEEKELFCWFKLPQY